MLVKIFLLMLIYNLVLRLSLRKIYIMKNLILPLLLVLLASSCEKEEVIDGCTDSTAINYNPEAVDDDSTCLYICEDIQAINYNDTIAYDVCEYESNIVVWLDETASQYFNNLGIPLLSINVGNEQIPGAIATENSYSDVECTDTNIGLIHYLYKWEDSLTTNVTFTVLDGTNTIMFQSTEVVLANGCAKLLLTRDKIEEYLGS